MRDTMAKKNNPKLWLKLVSNQMEKQGGCRYLWKETTPEMESLSATKFSSNSTVQFLGEKFHIFDGKKLNVRHDMYARLQIE